MRGASYESTVVFTFSVILGHFGQFQDFRGFEGGWGGEDGEDVFTIRNLLRRFKIDWLRVALEFTLFSCEFWLAGCWRATCACGVA